MAQTSQATQLDRGTTVYLSSLTTTRNSIEALASLEAAELRPHAAVLVAYPELKKFLAVRKPLHFREWVLDSGAYSVMSGAKEIDVEEYIDDCHKLLALPDPPSAIFCLDVIGNPTASWHNYQRMTDAGLDVIPTFHAGSPWSFLTDLTSAAQKVGLGGTAMVSFQAFNQPARKKRWLTECFRRVYPHKLHGFGVVGERMPFNFPFDSIDASNWKRVPNRWKKFAQFGNKTQFSQVGLPNIIGELLWYHALERRLQHRWAKELSKL